MQKHSSLNKLSLAGLIVTLGIIYGDIGTSPLYVMKAIIGSGTVINDMVILGGVSLIFWTLTLQTTIKYVIITLRADNKGEGGIFSLYALVRGSKNPWLVFPAMLGGATLLADGIITPPISVSSAIEGLTKIQPELPLIPIVLVIILSLFIIQRFGTNFVGKFFGPMMFVWFSMLAILGVSQMRYAPEIFKALNPYYGWQLLVNYPNGFLVLGAVFLCTTGAEALYSDLGHCGKQNIRVSWIFVKATLVLNYMGQGAWLLKHNGELLNDRNPFFELMAPWFLPIGIAISTMAAIIASQALISGSFTLINEAIRLNFWPKVKVVYPTEMRGQLYIPSVNWLLMLGCTGIVLFFQESAKMEAAYGLAIILTMLMTTILLTYYLHEKKVNPVLIAILLLTFLIIEFSFLAANLSKFSHGGWVTLLVASSLFIIMLVLYYSRKIRNRLVEFVYIKDYLPLIKGLSEDESVPKYATHLVYLTSANNLDEIEEKVFYSIFYKKPKRADVYWFVHVDVLDEPYTLEYKVTELLHDKLIRIDMRIGFRIDPRVNLMFRQIVTELVKNKEVDIISRYPSLMKRNLVGDFRFVVMEKFLSYDNELPWLQKIIMDFYFLIKKISLPEERAFGLDTSSVTVEKIPLVVKPIEGLKLTRME
ncbi:MAG: KUP/HAK/KT family potassium transporter [Bacteroidota bacterium]